MKHNISQNQDKNNKFDRKTFKDLKFYHKAY